MKINCFISLCAAAFLSMAVSTCAATSTAIGQVISAPSVMEEDSPSNTIIQAFNKVSIYLPGTALAIDSGTIAAGTRAESNRMFLNIAMGNANRNAT